MHRKNHSQTHNLPSVKSVIFVDFTLILQENHPNADRRTPMKTPKSLLWVRFPPGRPGNCPRTKSGGFFVFVKQAILKILHVPHNELNLLLYNLLMLYWDLRFFAFRGSWCSIYLENIKSINNTENFYIHL